MMTKIKFLKYRTIKNKWCDICNRPAQEKVMALFYNHDMIYGDLVLCAECHQMMEKMLREQDEVIAEWDFSKGVAKDGGIGLSHK